MGGLKDSWLKPDWAKIIKDVYSDNTMLDIIDEDFNRMSELSQFTTVISDRRIEIDEESRRIIGDYYDRVKYRHDAYMKEFEENTEHFDFWHKLATEEQKKLDRIDEMAAAYARAIIQSRRWDERQ